MNKVFRGLIKLLSYLSVHGIALVQLSYIVDIFISIRRFTIMSYAYEMVKALFLSA